MINGQLVGKLILEISVNDLLMDVSKSGIEGILDDDGNLTLSDTNFRILLKQRLPQLKRATEKHKQSCCCDICLTMMNMHEQLIKHRTRKVASLEKEWRTAVNSSRSTTNPFILSLMNDSINNKKARFETYKQYCFGENSPRYPKASDALTQIMCPKVVAGNNKSYFQWPCVIQHCQNFQRI